MNPTQLNFTDQERLRIIEAAQRLFLEHGIAHVTTTDVAFTLRLPLAVVENYFPGGKAALLEATITHYLGIFRQHLAQQRQHSSNAVEEILQLRRALLELPDEVRSLLLQRVADDYPAQWRQLNEGRAAITLDYVRANLSRGLTEGLYRPTIDAEVEAQQWLHESNDLVLTAHNASTLDEERFSQDKIVQLNNFLDRVTTPAGAYVARRLQEAPPYY